MAKVSWWAEHFYLVVAMFAVAFDPDRNLEVEYGRLMRGSLRKLMRGSLRKSDRPGPQCSSRRGG